MGAVRTNDKYSGAVVVTLARSWRLAAFIASGAGASLALVATTPLPVATAVLLATWLACAGLDAWRRGVRRRHLALGLDGSVAIDATPGRLRDGCFVAPWLTLVRWRPDGARFDRTVAVLPDMLPADDFRRLRVLLLHRGQTT